MKWGCDDAPQWSIEQAMHTLSLLHEAFRDNGYALTLHGSVSRNGRGNDLDLIAVPMEVAVTPPEQMEQLMCKLLGANPLPDEPRHGLLRTWARACIMEDGRQVDVEYRRPLPADRQTELLSHFLSVFWQHGYHLEFCSLPSGVGSNYLELIALAVKSNADPPEQMDQIMADVFQAQIASPPIDGSTSTRSYLVADEWALGIRYVGPTGGDLAVPHRT
jgi:hypothetical protein